MTLIVQIIADCFICGYPIFLCHLCSIFNFKQLLSVQAAAFSLAPYLDMNGTRYSPLPSAYYLAQIIYAIGKQVFEFVLNCTRWRIPITVHFSHFVSG